MNAVSDGAITKYEPSEKYAEREHLELPLKSELAPHVVAIHEANNLQIDAKALENPDRVFCYFARLRNEDGNRLTAVRRATAFKGVLKARLLQLGTDALKIVQDKVFRLDKDFDLLIDKTGIQILHPAGFEVLAQAQEAIVGAVPRNIEQVQRDLPFIDFGPVQEYAKHHPRAARYLASIRAQQETKGHQ